MSNRYRYLILIQLMCFSFALPAQMIVNSDTLYGNEWINYDQQYFKIKISQDGIYRIPYQTMADAGMFNGASTPQGAELKLFHLGKQVPIYVNNPNVLTNGDYVEFYGIKNRGELDVHLYEKPEYQLNPRYSLFTDTSAYYLTWNARGPHERYTAINNDLSNPPAKETHCWVEEVLEYHERLETGKKYGDGAAIKCGYDIAEGYCKKTFSSNQTFNFRTRNWFDSGESGKLTTRFYSANGAHDITITSNNEVVARDSFYNWRVSKYQLDIPGNLLGSNTVININGSSSDDKFRVAYLKLRYTHNFNFENSNSFTFEVEPDSEQKYLEISNFNSGNISPILYDNTNKLRIETIIENNMVKAILPPSSVNRVLVLCSQDNFTEIKNIEERFFKNFNNEHGKFLIVSNSKLFDDGSGANYVQKYAQYRSSPAGGNLKVVVADVLDIYDQFGYGIHRHEQSIKNFVHFALKNWQSDHLFILGKGISYNLLRNSNPNWLPYDFIPSYGYPNSDHLFSTDNGSGIPKIAVGRIAASNPSDIKIYLEKVKDFEAQQRNLNQSIVEKAWMKRILHLGGGDPTIAAFIRKDLNKLADSIANSSFGADMVSFFKYSTDAVQSAQTDEVVSVINDGTSVISFFGHSAPTTLDFDLGDPRSYNNEGKYPLMYIIGCNTNRIFEKVLSLSEDYVFVENKGAIGVYGATWQTSLGNLSRYAEFVYGNLGSKSYGKSIGEITKAAMEDMGPDPGFFMDQTRQVMILHGDPFVKINPHIAPDYLVNISKSSISPALVNATLDSFELTLVITNIGKSIKDSLPVSIEQELPDGSIISVKNIKIEAPMFEKELRVSITLEGRNAIGLHKLHIRLDSENAITELPAAAEMNNSATLNFAIISNDVIPVSPVNFSIINQPNPLLIASTANTFSKTVNYYFEFDTIPAFTSSFKFQTKITQEGGLVKWQIPNSLKDSTVYYWRVSIDSTLTEGQGFNWKTNSFVFIKNENQGWNQSHDPQYTENKTTELVLNPSFGFNKQEVFYKVKNAVVPTVLFDYEVSVFRDGSLFHGEYLCVPYDLVVVVLDSLTLEVKGNTNLAGSQGDYGSINCHGAPIANAFSFETGTPEGREVAINFLDNVVQDNEYVILYTIQRPNSNYEPEEWAGDSVSLGTNLFQVFERQGATQIRQTIERPVPYIFSYRKNDPTFTGGGEYLLDDLSSILEGNFVMPLSSSSGSLTSPPIGPAASWGSLHWKMESLEASDEVSVDVFGIDQDGNDSLLHEQILATDTTLQHIDAAQFPYLKLRLNLADSVNYTAPQLDYWRVLYEPYPELAIDPQSHFQFHKDTLQEGEQLRLQLAMQNISTVPMDSLLMKYTIKDKSNNEITSFQRLRPLPAGDTLTARFDTDTRGLDGNNLLTIEANPLEDQPELFHFNNLGVLEFFVQQDERNPLLEVTFDGTHIMDGDIVSPTPEIFIQVKDENEFLLLDDTSAFELLLSFPGTTDYQKIAIGDPAVVFTPATGNKNKASLLYRPEFDRDGQYKLRVQARDATGNKSGDQYYEVGFQVINKSSISNLVNYPNPFTTATRFVYTLTGNEVPANFKIQIMTVSGRIIREITAAEFGPLKTGTHLSDFVWNGTDQFGDPLANGVYLYRVVAKKANGEDWEKYDTGTDQYFKNDFGKMVILR